MRDTGGLGDMRNIGGSKATATPKMKLVVTIVIDGWQLQNINTLDVTAVLDSPFHLQSLKKEFFKIMESNFSIVLCGWMFFLFILWECKKYPFTEEI